MYKCRLFNVPAHLCEFLNWHCVEVVSIIYDTEINKYTLIYKEE